MVPYLVNSLIVVAVAVALVIATTDTSSVASHDYRHNINKRYVTSPKKWAHRLLKWRLDAGKMAESDRFIIRHTLHRAFNLWASASSLHFQEITNSESPVDILISFNRRVHGDGLPFDGQGGVVAHAFYPPVGALHFDEEEQWTLNQASGINLYQTAIHEIGHLLGLEHSSDTRAVMFPRRRPFNSKHNSYDLADDDVRGIRELYPLEELHVSGE